MSIIHEALQKTQELRQNQQLPNLLARHKNSWKKIPYLFAYGSIALAFASALLIYKLDHSSKPLPPPAPVLKKSTPPLVLKGVFISPQHKMAIINDRPLEIGDEIENMRLTHVDHQSITLKGRDNTLVNLPVR